MSIESRSDLIDRLMDVYVDWREECASLQRAYERWSRVAAADRALAFAAYRAALDREDWASQVYGGHLSLFTAAFADHPDDETEPQPPFVLAASPEGDAHGWSASSPYPSGPAQISTSRPDL